MTSSNFSEQDPPRQQLQLYQSFISGFITRLRTFQETLNGDSKTELNNLILEAQNLATQLGLEIDNIERPEPKRRKTNLSGDDKETSA